MQKQTEFLNKNKNVEIAQIPGVLTVEKLGIIGKEISKTKTERNTELVTKQLRNLNFFMKLNEASIVYIIENSNFVMYPKGHVIFKQGEFGDKMYVILRGSVRITI